MQKSIKNLIFDLSSDIEEVRKVAIIWLAQEGDEAVLPDLRRMTQDPSTAIRYFARRAIDTIEKRVKGVSDPSVPAAPQTKIQVEDWRARLAQEDAAARHAAAQAVAKLAEPQARALVRERLPLEPEPAVKAVLLAILAQHKNDADLDLIFGQLTEPHPNSRAAAVLALESFYHESIRDHLLPMVRDPDNRTRANVLLVLGRYDADLIAGPLAEMATSREIWNKDSALWVLRRLRTPRAVELLGRMHQENRADAYLFPKVDAALRELASKGDESAVQVLAALDAGKFEKTEGKLELERVLDDIESEADENDAREKRARRAAITNHDEFEVSLSDGDFERRLAAIDAGISIDPIAAAMAFRERLQIEQHPFVISKLIKELGRVGGPADIDVIAGQLGHPDARVRANAIEGLALLGGDQIYERIKPLLEDASPRVQATAARVTYSIDRERAFRKLKAMIVSRENANADAAIHALGDVQTDDVLELLELALGQDDQELRLKIFKVLQRLSAKSPVAAQIYASYREEGDGVLLKAGDLDQTVGVAVDPAADGRTQAVELLRHSADSRAQAALEKLARDRDPRVKREAMAALRVRDLELERGVMLYQLGSVLYRSWKRKELENVELDQAFGEVEKLGQLLDSGGDPAEVLTARAQAMAQAGRRSLDLVNEFELRHRARGPRPGEKSEELSVDGLPALAARIGQVDRKIEERLQAFYNELAVSPSAPLPPVERTATMERLPAERPVSGRVAAPAPDDDISSARTPPEGVPVGGAPVSTPKETPRPTAQATVTQAMPTFAPVGVAPSHAATEADLPPMRNAASGATPATRPASAASGSSPALAGSNAAMSATSGTIPMGEGARAPKSRAMRAPSGAMTAPIEAPATPAADRTMALIINWFQQNPALGAIGVALLGVMGLVVIASSMGGESFKGAWKRALKDTVKLHASGNDVLALSGSGVLTNISLATGKVDWQYAGPSLDGGYPLQVDAGQAYLSGSDGRIIAVNLRTGKKAWEFTTGPLLAPPQLTSGKLVALVKEPPSVILIDQKTGQKGATYTAAADVQAAVPGLGGVLIVRKKGLTLLDSSLARSQWDMVLPAEINPAVTPFEVGGAMMVLLNDLLLCLSKDGNKLWERRIEPGAIVLPGVQSRKEVYVIARKFVEVVDSAGKGGATAAMGVQWTQVELGKSDVMLCDAEGVVYLLDMREKSQRKLIEMKDPVRALARSGHIGLAAAADRVEAFSISVPKP